MITVLVGGGLVALASVLLGRGILALAGWRGSAWLAPAVGYGAFMIVCATGVQLATSATVGAVALVVLPLAALALRRVRRDLVAAAREGGVLGVVVLIASALPFLVSGRAFIPGAGRDNDMVAHLSATWYLGKETGIKPVGAFGEDLITGGYPLGPHALAAALQRLTGISVEHAFDAISLALPVVAALTVLAVFEGRPRRGRTFVAGVVGLSYLGTSYLVQGTMKEVLEASLLVAFALALQELVRLGRPRARDGIVLGILVATGVYVYSYAGVFWPIGALGILLLAELVRRRGRVLRALPALLGVAGVAAVTLAVLGASQIGRMTTFADSTYAAETGPGNLVTALPLKQALGVWLGGDYRFAPDPAWLSGLLTIFAVVALAFGVVWWLRRGALAVPAALGAALIIYWQATKSGHGIYTDAKGLVILAPIAVLAWTAPLPDLWRRPRPRERRARLAGRYALGLVGAVALVGAAASTFLALRNGPVAPTEQIGELAGLRPMLGYEPTLYLGMDDFGRYALRGANVSTGPQLYSPMEKLAVLRGSKVLRFNSPVDFDNFSSQTLDSYTYVITSGGGYQSMPPPNFAVVRRTRSFVVWKRNGPTPGRIPSERNGAPGKIFRCDSSPRARWLARQGAHAAVLAQPAVGSTLAWSGPPNRRGLTSSQVVQLPAGTWDLSLQYWSPVGMELRAGDLRASLPATVAMLGPFWPAGVVHQAHAGPVRVTVTAKRMNALARLLDAPDTRTMVAPGNKPLAKLAFTRHGQQVQLVPLAQACDRYVDWFTLH